MYDVVHGMRSRIITSPAFSGDKVIGAILFENTMVCSLSNLCGGSLRTGNISHAPKFLSCFTSPDDFESMSVNCSHFFPESVDNHWFRQCHSSNPHKNRIVSKYRTVI